MQVLEGNAPGTQFEASAWFYSHEDDYIGHSQSNVVLMVNIFMKIGHG